jgi:hypothetical protein
MKVNKLPAYYSQGSRRIQGEHSPSAIACRPADKGDKIFRLAISVQVEGKRPVSFGLYLYTFPPHGSQHDML